MALDAILHFNAPRRTEAEVLAARPAPEVLSLARSIERSRLEAGNERLMSQQGPDYRRWEALMNGAMPDARSIEEAKRREARAIRSGLLIRVTLMQGNDLRLFSPRMDATEFFEDFYVGEREQAQVIEAVKAGRSIKLDVFGGLAAEIEPPRSVA